VNKPVVDQITFITAVVIILLVSVPILIWPAAAGPIISGLYDWIAENLGLYYQWAVVGAISFLGWMAFSRFGKIRLGEPDEEPEFSTYSWVAMLFCAGVGAGLLYWAAIEWVSYYDSPPFSAEPRSSEAIQWATSYGLFHWGLAAWCIYALPTVAIAYPYYVKKVPYLRLSTACHGLLGEKGENSAIGRAMDVAFMIALIGGAGTSLGLATPMIAASFGQIFGIETGFGLEVTVVVICVSLFALSVYLGLEKGIKNLSDVNAVLAIIFLIYVLVTGPTLFILRTGTESIGFMLANMIEMITYTDPVNRTGFVEDWTVFYWAWWIAYAPFVGIFVTRISRGRTIRQVILSMAVFGSLGSWVFYVVLGDYALYMQINGILSVSDVMANQGTPAAIVQVVSSVPFGGIALAVFALVSIVFVATTYDSASYTLASAATAKLRAGENPARWHRLFWAAMLGVLPVLLMFLGGLKVIQSATLVASLPILIISVFMCVSLVKSLRED
jgi:BCCT family betaine/carnitine transporter